MLIGVDKGKVAPSRLTKAKYLPSLESKIWQNLDKDDDPRSLTPQQRIDIKRAKIDINIIMRESDNAAKYDLFERINTGGSKLSDQEVRNCLLGVGRNVIPTPCLGCIGVVDVPLKLCHTRRMSGTLTLIGQINK